MRVKAVVGDNPSPQGLKLASDYLIDALEHEAADADVALDWGRFHTYTQRSRRHGLILIAWAPVLR